MKVIGEVGFGIWDPNGVTVVLSRGGEGGSLYSLPLPAPSGSYTASNMQFTVPAGTTKTLLFVWLENDPCSIQVDNNSVVSL